MVLGRNQSQQKSTIADRGMIDADSSTGQGLREALNPAAKYDCDPGTRMTKETSLDDLVVGKDDRPHYIRLGKPWKALECENDIE